MAGIVRGVAAHDQRATRASQPEPRYDGRARRDSQGGPGCGPPTSLALRARAHSLPRRRAGAAERDVRRALELRLRQLLAALSRSITSGPNLARYPAVAGRDRDAIHPRRARRAVRQPSALSRDARAWWLLTFALTVDRVLPAVPGVRRVVVLEISAARVSGRCSCWRQRARRRLVARLAPAPRLAALVLLAVALGGSRLAIAEDRAVFELRDLERRFRDGGEYVARKLPPNAVVFTTQQSGSVRFYSGRPTIIWDMLDPAWLDRAVEHYQRRGLRPFFLFEQEEDRGFRARFESHSRLGGLEWPPAALIGREIKIFDPLDYERFRQGREDRNGLCVQTIVKIFHHEGTKARRQRRTRGFSSARVCPNSSS